MLKEYNYKKTLVDYTDIPVRYLSVIFTFCPVK